MMRMMYCTYLLQIIIGTHGFENEIHTNRLNIVGRDERIHSHRHINVRHRRRINIKQTKVDIHNNIQTHTIHKHTSIHLNRKIKFNLIRS